MSAREAILSAIRAAAVPAAPARRTITNSAGAAPPVEMFLRVLMEVGGHGVVRENAQSLDDAIAEIRAGLGAASGELLVIAGRLAVAENGAVYVDAADIAARTDVVLTEHLVIVVPIAAVMPTMHEAVLRIPEHSACGWFLSGPSKTADIEQALVVGAQGSRTLHVILDSRTP
jgi:L-lactate dehydrogenase complex protein LldG